MQSKRIKEDPVRPIPARLLKSCIDTLRPRLGNSRILELYAGQGRFSIAALKEGALHATLVENHPKVLIELVKLLRNYSDRSQVVRSDVLEFLKRKPEHLYDLIFADPPFPAWQGDFSERLFSSVKSSLLPGSIFLVKSPARMVLSCPQGFELWKSTGVGDSKLSYFVYEEKEINF